jgi:magnesium transporter
MMAALTSTSLPMRVVVLRGPEFATDPPEPLESLIGRAGQVLWIDLQEPGPDTMGRLAELFHLHPLAVEDAIQRAQRPKAEEYDKFIFITTHAAHSTGPQAEDIALDEIDIFYGPGFVITVHNGSLRVIDEMTRRIQQAPPDLRCTNGYLLYVVLDVVVDSYFPVLDNLDDYIERLEDTLFVNPAREVMDRLFASKRALLNLRRVASPQRDMMNLMMRHDTTMVGEPLRAYFRDIYDHLLRITEQIDTHRDLLAGALDIYLSLVSNRLNEVVKVLTVITAVFAVLTVIAGFYGMNFVHTWPPFDAPWGVPATIIIMVLFVVLMLAVFRVRRWL